VSSTSPHPLSPDPLPEDAIPEEAPGAGLTPGFLAPDGGTTGATPVPRARVPVGGIIGALVLMAMLGAAMIAGAIALHAVRSEPRDARALVTREIAQRVLEPGERPRRIVQVFRRSARDYFRRTRGLLLLTDRRLLYVGLVPRDILDPSEELPTFERRSLGVDTSLALTTGRTPLGVSRALILATPRERLVLGVPVASWSAALAVVADVGAHQAAQREEGRRLRRAREVADSIARAPVYHVVQRGEALDLIARKYNTTVERLRELNHLGDNRIRAGDSILVKPQT
jgi:hypothetical protein